MAQYVALFRGKVCQMQADLSAVEAVRGLSIIRRTPAGLLLVEFDGTAEALSAAMVEAGATAEWVVARQRTYRLA